jgi:hypothetical protein
LLSFVVGNITVIRLPSTKDGTFIEPSAASGIGAAFADGTNVIMFIPALGPFMEIKVTEGNVGAITSLTAYLFVQ